MKCSEVPGEFGEWFVFDILMITSKLITPKKLSNQTDKI